MTSTKRYSRPTFVLMIFKAVADCLTGLVNDPAVPLQVEIAGVKYYLKSRYAHKKEKFELLLQEWEIAKTLSGLYGTAIPVYVAFLASGTQRLLLTRLVEDARPLQLADLCDRSVLQSLVSALSLLHAQHVVHNDISPQNVLVHPTRGCLLIDLDLATFAPTSALFSPQPVQRFGHLSLPNRYHAGQFRGNKRYASINAHLGLVPTFGNDLVSVYYLWLHASSALADRSLPWSQAPPLSYENVLALKLQVSPPAVLDLSRAAHLPSEREKALCLLQLLAQEHDKRVEDHTSIAGDACWLAGRPSASRVLSSGTSSTVERTSRFVGCHRCRALYFPCRSLHWVSLLVQLTVSCQYITSRRHWSTERPPWTV